MIEDTVAKVHMVQAIRCWVGNDGTTWRSETVQLTLPAFRGDSLLESLMSDLRAASPEIVTSSDPEKRGGDFVQVNRSSLVAMQSRGVFRS